ncbi:hypothetical protein BG011_008082 [Mortierella polycephala]|uniref:Homeobox domain-containing protein n=1 Tax=Mortierella polycephala TaxID=41804 RepID=A0A9P6QCP7_9FUNG|nr:hypothetical protein BG011_008082 [Mortierella polycephala]
MFLSGTTVTSTPTTTPQTESDPTMQKTVNTLDWAAKVKKEPTEPDTVASYSPALPKHSSSTKMDCTASSEPTEPVIGTFSVPAPAAVSSTIPPTSPSTLSTVVAASPPKRNNTDISSATTSFSLTSPTLPYPLLASDSATDEEDITTRGESTRFSLMSPPLSQGSQGSNPDCDTAKESSQQPQQPSLHPFDPISPTSTKKTLNWVNALPSHFDSASSGHPRKRRRRTNREELEILEDAFAKNLLPDAATRQELGERLGMNVRAVQIWFQNRRQTLRKKSISSSVHDAGSEDDASRSEGEPCDLIQRRYSGDSGMSMSPVLSPRRRQGHVSKLGSRSCSDLNSSPQQQSRTRPLLRAETCSSLPVVTPTPSSTLTNPSTSANESTLQDNVTDESINVEAAVKVEEVELIPKSTLSTTRSVQDIVDAKTADLHLGILLEEAKRRSKQGAAPVMAMWPKTDSKAILNTTLTGTLPSGTASFPPSARSLSMPSARSSYYGGSSQLQSRPGSRHARKHRSMPEPSSSSPRYPCSPYPRTMSLMEQVINRQQQQHLYRPTPTNFKQSTLSSTGKHYSGDSISHKAARSSVITSSGMSAAQLARRLQYVPAMRARRLSIGKYLFDSDTDGESPQVKATMPAHRLMQQQQQSELTYQAQKRQVATAGTLNHNQSADIDGDETDEEDFVALNERVKKRLNSTATSFSHMDFKRQPQQQSYQHPQDWSATHRTPIKCLKNSLSTLSLVAFNPTREYGLGLDQSHGSPMSHFHPGLERNHAWDGPKSEPQQSMGGNPSTASGTLSPNPANTGDLNMDELECASVLAGLGWCR